MRTWLELEVGQDVQVVLMYGGLRLAGKLLAADDWGIVVKNKADESLPGMSGTYVVPWTTVAYLQPTE